MYKVTYSYINKIISNNRSLQMGNTNNFNVQSKQTKKKYKITYNNWSTKLRKRAGCNLSNRASMISQSA